MSNIRWKRVLLGGVLTEITLFAIFIPMQMIGLVAPYYSVPFLVIAAAMLFGYWVAGVAGNRFILHGALVAITASAIYACLTMTSATPVPVLYHVANGLRVFGGMLGGWLAERRARPAFAH